MKGTTDAGERVGLLARALTAGVSVLRQWGIALLGAIVLMPFLALSFFNHPALDDFDYAWQTLHRGFWGAQSAWYWWWTGRYVNSAIMSLNPLVVRWPGGFKVLPLLLLMLLAGTMYFFVRELTRPEWSIRTRLAATTVLLVLYLQGMPNVAEGLYWLSSASTYQLANAFCLVLAGAMVRRFREGRRWPGWRLTAAALVSIVIVMGSNETSMVVVLFLLAAVFAFRAWADRRFDRWTGLLLSVAMASAAVAIVAPGNVSRMTYESPFHGHAPALLSAGNSVVDAARQVVAWIQSGPLLLFAILFVPAAAPLARRKGEAGPFRIHPAVIFCVLFAAMTLACFPTYWSLGHAPEPRTLNVVYLLFLSGFFVALVSGLRVVSGGSEVRVPGYAVALLALVIAVAFKSPQGNVRLAYSDLLSGRAWRFDREMRDRERWLAACQTALCEVDPLVDPPMTLFVADVDPRTEENAAIAHYFGKKAVRLKPTR